MVVAEKASEALTPPKATPVMLASNIVDEFVAEPFMMEADWHPCVRGRRLSLPEIGVLSHDRIGEARTRSRCR